MSIRIKDIVDARCVVGDQVQITVRDLKDKNGVAYDLSGASKIYCTIKAALADVDGSALVNINSVSNPTQFTLTNAATGNIVVTLSATNTATLTAGTNYFLDVKAIWASGAILSIVNEPEFRLVGRVTAATT